MKLLLSPLLMALALLSSSLAQAATCEIMGEGYSGGWIVRGHVVGNKVIGPYFTGGQGEVGSFQGNAIIAEAYSGGWAKSGYLSGNIIMGEGFTGGIVKSGEIRGNDIYAEGNSGGWVRMGSFSQDCTKMQAAAGAYVLLLKYHVRGGGLGLQRGLY
ncbi:MAG: hypothetical protein ACXVC0_03760 [Bdellovibrionota bacterium]